MDGSSAPGTGEPEVSGLEAHLGYWLRFVSNHVSRAFQAKVEAAGVTVSEWVVLRQLHDVEGASPGELMEALGMTQGAISKLVSRLEAKGLARRGGAGKDRRRQSVALTGEGRALVPILAGLADENDREFFGVLPEAARERVMAAMKELVRTHRLKEMPVD
ncbi:MAG TPA: MarR family winged helix-turn-helix transcriptional regulator [Longimicrobium sp.]|nr:MarR family winged helix-turn-helix transcriptional regulator [Longimicrobium sp.]